MSEKQNSNFDVTIDRYLPRVELHQSLMRTASDTIRDSEILADNLLTIMQRMTYQ